VDEENPTTELADEDLKILATEIADEVLMIPATELADEMVNPMIDMADVNFDNEIFANDDWLQMMQQKYDIDMMLFGEITPLQLVEDNLFAAAQVSEEEAEKKTETKQKEETEKAAETETKKEVCKEKEETKKEKETEAKKDVCKRNAETEIEAEKEAPQQTAPIVEQKE